MLSIRYRTLHLFYQDNYFQLLIGMEVPFVKQAGEQDINGVIKSNCICNLLFVSFYKYVYERLHRGPQICTENRPKPSRMSRNDSPETSDRRTWK